MIVYFISKFKVYDFHLGEKIGFGGLTPSRSSFQVIWSTFYFIHSLSCQDQKEMNQNKQTKKNVMEMNLHIVYF